MTCLYRGLPITGVWSRLAAAEIDHRFLPSVLVGLRLGLAKPCFGSTMALRAETLRRIGGFAAFADQLADDYAIGAAVRRLGLEVAIPPMVVDHVCSEHSFVELARRELRWARTIRLVDPLGYRGSVVTHPLPFALVAAALQGFAPASLAILGLVLACGLLVPLQFARSLGGGRVPIWLTPVRDLLSFAIFLVSFLPWRSCGGDAATKSARMGRLHRLRETQNPMRTLFLQAPSFDGFDGGAGSRYQARREIHSFWYPTWLAQPAALVANCKLIDAPPHGVRLADVLRSSARDYDLVVLHTSTPSFAADVAVVEALKAANPNLMVGLIGAKVAVEADESLRAAPVSRFRRAQRVRLHDQGSRRRARARETSKGSAIATRQA